MSKKTQVKVIKTTTASLQDVVDVTLEMGDKLNDMWKETADMKVAQMSLAAYNTALKATAIQLINKKLTGMPKTIKALGK